jgi:uncharacterized protein (TIGR03083 family)
MTPGLTDQELFAALDAAVAAFTTVGSAHDAAAVPACPGWTVADVFEHQGRVHRWAAGCVAAGGERPHRDRSPLAPGTDLHRYLAEGAEVVRTTLHDADLDATVWTFIGPRPVRWWLRRQVHETTVHGWDVVDAAGATPEIDPAVAADGVDELLDVLAPLVFDAGAFGGTGQTIHVHATDTPGEWLVTIGPEGFTVRREHAKGDVAARGPAAELLAALWGRRPLTGLDTFGDVDLLARFYQATAPKI